MQKVEALRMLAIKAAGTGIWGVIQASYASSKAHLLLDATKEAKVGTHLMLPSPE